MADRTWNQTDARLYDEEWSAGAIIVANCLLTRCPNPYGVFDMPWGFLIRFFQGIFTAMEIRAFVQELEAGEPEKRFMTLYRDRSVVWIRSKWKRAGKPSPLHWKGLENHLADFPEVSIDFKAYYNPYWEGIQSPLKGDAKGIKGGSIPPVNPDSESESELGLENPKKDFRPQTADSDELPPAKSEERSPEKPKRRKYTDWLISEKPHERILGYWVEQYKAAFGVLPTLDMKTAPKTAAFLLNCGHSELEIQAGIRRYLAMDPAKSGEFDAKWIDGHPWPMFVRHKDKLIKPLHKKPVGSEVKPELLCTACGHWTDSQAACPVSGQSMIRELGCGDQGPAIACGKFKAAGPPN